MIPSEQTTSGRPILICIVAIAALTLIAIVGMFTRAIGAEELVLILGFIAGVGGFGAGAHLAAAERYRAALLSRELTTIASSSSSRPS